MVLARRPPTRLRLAEHQWPWLTWLGILAVYGLLIVPTVDRLGIGWDEAVDLDIARAYLTPRGLLLGLPLDQTQTRLPMFSVALVYRLVGASTLHLARLTSIAVGGLTLLGTYVYGRDQFGHKAGLIAAALLALNPFFLAFARLAFTESDIYLACTLIWLLVLLARLQHRPTVGTAAAAGVVLGLSLAAKATVLVVVPAAVLTIWVSGTALGAGRVRETDRPAPQVSARQVHWWALWAIWVLVAGVYSRWRLEALAPSGLLKTLHYGLVWLGWALVIGWSWRHRVSLAPSIPLAALVVGIGLLTFVIFPPDHLTNPGILRSLFTRAESEMSLNASFVGELAALHVLAVFFKSTPVLGFFLLTGFIAGLRQWRRPAFRLPLLTAGSYSVGLLLLPLGQTFYTVPILSVLSLVGAEQFVRLWSARRRMALALALVTAGWWVVEMIQIYPDYHLNGYQWLGKRVLFGRSSIGYRSVVFTPADGVEQAVAWLNAHAEPGEVVQLYGAPWHLVRYAAPDPVYQFTNGLEATLSDGPDYVMLHLNDLLWQGHGLDTPVGEVVRYPLDPAALEREYVRVFVVERALDLEVASVWKRR